MSKDKNNKITTKAFLLCVFNIVTARALPPRSAPEYSSHQNIEQSMNYLLLDPILLKLILDILYILYVFN